MEHQTYFVQDYSPQRPMINIVYPDNIFADHEFFPSFPIILLVSNNLMEELLSNPFWVAINLHFRTPDIFPYFLLL